LTLDRVEVTLVRICGRGLPTYQIRWKSEKLFVDVRTYGRMDGRTHLSSNLLGHRLGDDLKMKDFLRSQAVKYAIKVIISWNSARRRHCYYRLLTEGDVWSFPMTFRSFTYCKLFMAALCNRAGHYTFALWFLLSFFLSFFFFLFFLT